MQSGGELEDHISKSFKPRGSFYAAEFNPLRSRVGQWLECGCGWVERDYIIQLDGCFEKASAVSFVSPAPVREHGIPSGFSPFLCQVGPIAVANFPRASLLVLVSILFGV